MHSKPFARYLGGAWRVLLRALVVARVGAVGAREVGRARWWSAGLSGLGIGAGRR